MRRPDFPREPVLSGLTVAAMHKAGARAQASGRALFEVLAADLACEPRPLVRDAARLLGLEAVETADLLTWTPALDLLPLARAQ